LSETIEEIFCRKIAAELAVRPHGYQAELAGNLGVSKSALNNLIRGRRGSTEDLRRAICREIGRDYDEFVLGVERPESPAASPQFQEFLDLYSRYGSPAFLEMCIDRLKAIKVTVEGER